MKNSNKIFLLILVITIVLSVSIIGAVFIYTNRDDSSDSDSTTSTKRSTTRSYDNKQQPFAQMDISSIKESIETAVEDGDLTERQGELLIAQLDSMSSMTPGERPSQNNANIPPELPENGENNQNGMLQSIVDQLNEDGYETTVDELTEAREAAEEAGIEMMGGGRGPQGSDSDTF